MADISKLNPNGTEYNIKDATARSDISTIKSTLIEAQTSNKDKVWKTDATTGVPSWQTVSGGGSTVVPNPTGTATTDLTKIGIDGTNYNIPTPDISGKADKVSNATNGNLAGLNSNGNLTDSGKKPSDFALASSLGDLASKDSVSASYTPAGGVTVTQGTDTTTSVGSMTGVGTLPSLMVDGTKLKFSAGALPTKESVAVVTASGTRSASFSGTGATITSS